MNDAGPRKTPSPARKIWTTIPTTSSQATTRWTDRAIERMTYLRCGSRLGSAAVPR